jgi:hypothetical protein
VAARLRNSALPDLSRRPGERASAEQVDVKVEDGLSGTGSDVENRAVALLDVALAGDVGGGEVAAADEFGVCGLSFFQSGEMFLGNDENVCGRLRIDVFESEDMVILVNFSGGNFALDDAAEEAIGFGHDWFTCDWFSHNFTRARSAFAESSRE